MKRRKCRSGTALFPPTVYRSENLAKPNFQYEKRQKELEKKRKKEEKKQRKLNQSAATGDQQAAPDAAAPPASDADNGGD